MLALRENPLLLLFVVAALGHPLGEIRFRGTSLGPAAVLFVGLALGAIDPQLKLPEIISQLGLLLFVYSVGLSSGTGFFASFRRRGLRDSAFVVGVLGAAVTLVVVAQLVLGLRPATASGLFAGSLTNTPALAAVLEAIRQRFPTAAADVLSEPAVAYSVAYPMGVLGVLFAAALAMKWWRVDFASEEASLREMPLTDQKLVCRTIHVASGASETLGELSARHSWKVSFGRIKRSGETILATDDQRLRPGDLVTVVGPIKRLEQVIACLGTLSEEQIELDRRVLDFRRIFVSNAAVVGQRLRDLNLPQQFGAMITRVRRGDVEFLPHGDTALELGDRVRVLTHRNNMPAVTAFFGDSYRAVSEMKVLPISFGMALGILLGTLPLPLPGGIVLKLGLAGGPLIVALILGAMERTRDIVWSMPFSVNLTIRQFGMLLFLAGVGIRAGHSFWETITQGDGLVLFAAGTCVTCATAWTTLWFGYRVLRIPMAILLGMLAGIQTQPAVLAYAVQRTGNDLPNVGYASVFPVATIGKILLAQLLLNAL